MQRVHVINLGSVERHSDGSVTYNTCFFQCLKAKTQCAYRDLLALGAFPESVCGHMTDLERHEEFINNLARALDVQIKVYTGIRIGDDIYIRDAVTHFPTPDLASLDGPLPNSDKPLISIVCVSNHYMLFETEEERAQSEQRRAQEEADAKYAESLRQEEEERVARVERYRQAYVAARDAAIPVAYCPPTLRV